jgi:hypothetical protein
MLGQEQIDTVKTGAEAAIAAIEVEVKKATKWYTSLLPWMKWLLIAGVICLLAWLLWAKFGSQPKLSTTEFAAVKPISEVKNVSRVVVQVPKGIKVYQKQELAKKVNIPKEIIASPTKEVIATGDIPASDYGTEALAITDTATGDSEIIAKAKPRPLFSLEKHGAVGVRAGVSTRDGYTGEAYVRQDLFQIGGVYVSAYGAVEGNASGKANAKAMLQVDLFRW